MSIRVFVAHEMANQRVTSVAMLPANVNLVLVLTNKSQTDSVMQQIIDKGIKNV